MCRAKSDIAETGEPTKPHAIGRLLSAVLLAVMTASAETLYEQDGVILDGSVRLAARAAATCVAAPAADEATKVNAGQPLHVWRLDYGVYNGSGRDLSNVTAHVRIESEWPPCSSWDGPEARFPGPLEWAGSYKVLQRSGGLPAAGEARETAYVLAFHDRQPRFANWQLDFGFGEPSASPEVEPAPSPAKPAPGPQPLCEGPRDSFECWVELANHPGCYVWNVGYTPSEPVSWNGECADGLADGSGTITGTPERFAGETPSDIERAGWPPYESRGTYEEGKRQGHWIDREASNVVDEGPYVDGMRHGRWVSRFDSGSIAEGPYVNGKPRGRWVTRTPEGRTYIETYDRGESVE